MKRPGVGAVVARLQVHKLHEGHIALLDKANEHQKLLVFLCISPHLVTPNDPLDYPARAQMVKDRYPGAVILPLMDQPTDAGWSASIDGWLGATCPTDSVTLYFGRSSSIASYQGHLKTAEIDEVPYVSGTDLRAEAGKTVIGSEMFRAGVIYAAHNMWPRATAVVDIAMTRQMDTGTIEVLLGMRKNEPGKFRFPGGHVNISDIDGETAARRELLEETGLEAGELEVVGNYRVKSWKTSVNYALFTTLYHAQYTFGAAVAGDDLDEIGWVPVPKLTATEFAEDHAMLAQKLIAYLERKRK